MKIILTESQYRVLTENTVEINQILDKIGKFGYENLENDEKLTLNQYSEWLKTGKSGEFTPKSFDFESKNNDFKGKIGEEYSTYLPDGSEFSFKYDYSEILNKENIYYGVVKWHGEEWVGLIATDKSGKLTDIDFVLESEGFQTYDSNNEFEGYNNEGEVRLQNKLKKDIHQVKYFFENEVVINLNDL
jgi:hypothetical protein